MTTKTAAEVRTTLPAFAARSTDKRYGVSTVPGQMVLGAHLAFADLEEAKGVAQTEANKRGEPVGVIDFCGPSDSNGARGFIAQYQPTSLRDWLNAYGFSTNKVAGICEYYKNHHRSRRTVSVPAGSGVVRKEDGVWKVYTVEGAAYRVGLKEQSAFDE